MDTNNKYLYVVKQRNAGIDLFRLRNSISNRIVDTYYEKMTNLYDIVKMFKDKYPDAWIDVRIGKNTGHLYKIGEWVESCEDGLFIDDDGNGSPLDENFEYVGFSVNPSDINKIDKSVVKYILWFNK